MKLRKVIIACVVSMSSIGAASAEQSDLESAVQSDLLNRNQQIFSSTVYALECERLISQVNSLSEGARAKVLDEFEKTELGRKVLSEYLECTDHAVMGAKRAERELMRLADSGFLPAIEFFIRKPLSTISLDPIDEDALSAYRAKAKSYMSTALSKGSGEAHYILAKRHLALANSSAGNEADLVDAFIASEVAIHCGYRNANSFYLSNRLLKLLRYDVKRAATRIKAVVADRCQINEVSVHQ